MLNKPLKFKNIIRRANSSKFKYSNSGRMFEEGFELSGKVKDNDALYNDQINAYINESTSYTNCIDILSRLYDENKYQLLESTARKIIRDVIPDIAPDCIKPCMIYIESSNIGDANKDKLLDALRAYKSIDRILENHNKLSKRFELESFTNNRLSIKDKCNLICELVDTYKTSPFIKFNIALEELSLLSSISGCPINESDMVEGVTNYFLLRRENSIEDIDSYKKAILESKVLSTGADSKVQYLTKDKSTDILESVIQDGSWENKLNNWKLNPDKNSNDLINILKENCCNIDAIRSIIETVNDFFKINDIETDVNLLSRIVTECGLKNFNPKEAASMSKYIEESVHDMNGILEDQINIMYDICEADKTNLSYANTDDIVEDLQYTFSDGGFDKYRLNNLIQDSITTSKMIDKQSAMKEYGLDVYDFENESNRITEDNYCDFVDESGHISLKIASLVNTDRFHDKHSRSDAMNFIESTVKCMNNALLNRDSRVYSIMNDGVYDIYLRTNYAVPMSIQQEHDRMFAPEDIRNLAVFEECVQVAELYQEKALNLYKRIMNRSVLSSISEDAGILLTESMENLFWADFVDEFYKGCVREGNNFNINNSDYLSFWYPEENIDLLKENFDIANDIVRFATPGRVLEEGVNLNTLRLTWQAFKKKVKNFSAKEKEMCRDLDATFNHFLKGVQSFFEVDHREQIITGQIRPSLSKMLKIALGLAGLGIATNFYVSAVVAVAGLAINKRTSVKEKNMILDEIDIELKVVDRELQKAEASGSTKKYRYLLTVQKNLQRERQRIYYNLSTKGKVPLPSTSGQDRGGRD